MPLSAIAARKAAQAAKLKTSTQDDLSNAGIDIDPSEANSVTKSRSSSSVTSAVTPNSPGSRKRKTRVDDNSIPRNKKARGLVNADIGLNRYFHANQPVEGLEEDDFESRSNSASNDEGPGEELIEIQESTISHSKRAYSPSRPVADSSDEEEPPLIQNAEIIQAAPIQDSLQLPANIFRPKPEVNTFKLSSQEIRALRLSDTDTATIIGLLSEQTLTFVGSALITVLYGSVSLLGIQLRKSCISYPVYSPKCSPLVTISALKNGDDKMEGTSNIVRFPTRLRKILEHSDAALAIQPLFSGVSGLGKIMRPLAGAFESSPEGHEEESMRALDVKGFWPLDLQENPRSNMTSFLMPEQWAKTLDNLAILSDGQTSANDKFIGVVKGPKNCGKSTFARTLLSRLCTRFRHVAFLECDIGQSAFAPGGMVSLHVLSRPIFGPSFTQLRRPYRAHYIGASSPRSNPSYYLSCIESLVQKYMTDIQHTYQEMDEFEGSEDDARSDTFIPLVINTQGWIKGLGGDLLRKIQNLAQPTDIFDLDPQNSMIPIQRLQASSPARLHQVKAILNPPLALYYTASDYRAMSMVSYFHSHSLASDGGSMTWTTEFPLCARVPWEVDCKEAIQQIILIGAGYEDVPPQELGKAINCSIVALIAEEDAGFNSKENREEEETWPYTQGSPTPSPNDTHCIGLAFIRGLDSERHILHLLTPVPLQELSKCRILVKGELDMPIWGFLDFHQDGGVAGVKWEKVPYLQMGAGDSTVIGGARRRTRRNLMRRSQM